MDLDREPSQNEGQGCDITRRHALGVMVKGGLVLVCAMLAGESAEAAPQWVAVGAAAQFKVGVPQKVTLPGGPPIFILKQDKTHWLAISAICTHAGAELSWKADAKVFACPKHGATFNATGGDPKAPARKPLPTYPVTLKGKQVQVDASKIAKPGAKPE
jgi:cytochrome b6-f complex iron-sulfur subunit